MGKKSDKAVRELVTNKFGGQIVHQYVNIDGVEYLIKRDLDRLDCGFEVRKMDWEHGNNWKYSSPY